MLLIATAPSNGTQVSEAWLADTVPADILAEVLWFMDAWQASSPGPFRPATCMLPAWRASASGGYPARALWLSLRLAREDTLAS